MKQENLNYFETIKKVGIVTIIVNIVLAVGKLIAGIVGSSQAMISDSIHSASDVFTTIIVMIGAKLSSKKADKEHPYGHERMEPIASQLLAILLFATAIGIGYSGVTTLIDYSNGKQIVSNNLTYLALIASIASIIAKGWMFFYAYFIAKKIRSDSLKADAYHHLTDSLSSIGSLIGIIGLMIGDKWAILDPIASLVICIFIVKVSIDIALSATKQLVDRSVDEKTIKEIEDVINSVENVKGIEELKTRKFGNKIYIDASIFLDETLSLNEAHHIAHIVHDSVENKIADVKHCNIHYSPNNSEEIEK